MLLRPASPTRYDDPGEYWEGRADELVRTYDRPDTWPQLGWMREGAEEETIPRLLLEANARTVLVVGAGSGRQYEFLEGFEVIGVDISKTLVRVCRDRYPDIPTTVGDVRELEADDVDAVISSAVLQHVPPEDIEGTIQRIKRVAKRLVILRELSRLGTTSTYQFVHDYRLLMQPWTLTHEEVTDDRAIAEVELLAFRPPVGLAS